MNKMPISRSGFGLLALLSVLSVTSLASCTKENVGPRRGCGAHTTTSTVVTDTTTTVVTDTTATRSGQ